MTRSGDSGRLVWTGRLPDAWPGGADGWSHSWQDLAEELTRVDDLVVLDGPSFPWQLITGPVRRARLVLRLPDELDAGQIAQLLRRPLAELTAYDRLLEGRPEVRAALTEQFDLPDVWVDGTTEALHDLLADVGALAEARAQRARLVQQADELAQALSELPSGPALVALSGVHQLRAQHLAAISGREVRRAERWEDDADLPAPDAVAVVLDDGGQVRHSRVELLRAAHRQLHPGGSLIVLGHVVTRADGLPNPSISELVEEVHEATGLSVHLEDLRSVRWAGETMSRAALLRFTSLRPRGA